jgi:hypothetical protein
MFSFRRDKMGFFAGIILITISAGTVISTLVLLVVGVAKGDWTAYLLPVKWILGVAWVLCIATVLTRIYVFGWQQRRAQDRALEHETASTEQREESTQS